jgi:hypothetical protein
MDKPSEALHTAHVLRLEVELSRLELCAVRDGTVALHSPGTVSKAGLYSASPAGSQLQLAFGKGQRPSTALPFRACCSSLGLALSDSIAIAAVVTAADKDAL